MFQHHTFSQFQSTLPCGSDYEYGLLNKPAVISIHAPLRERPFWFFVPERLLFISIHAPLRERRVVSPDARLQRPISIHAPLRERPDFN